MGVRFVRVAALGLRRRGGACGFGTSWLCVHLAVLGSRRFGGIGASPIERIIWSEEESKFDVPRGIYEIGLGMAGPVLMTYATEEQKQRYLPPMAKGEEIWCQLFSEPGAGSDLAGIKTKAELDGDTWTINGQKVWTSGAQYSDYGILVTRSDFSAPKLETIRTAFIGVGARGSGHLKAFSMIDGIEVVAICDLHEDLVESSNKIVKDIGNGGKHINIAKYHGSENNWKKMLKME